MNISYMVLYSLHTHTHTQTAASLVASHPSMHTQHWPTLQLQQLSLADLTKLQRQLEVVEGRHTALAKELAALKVCVGF